MYRVELELSPVRILFVFISYFLNVLFRRFFTFFKMEII